MSQTELMQAQTEAIRATKPFSNARILIVDDDLEICESLTMILEMEGYVADKAMCGQEAIMFARSRSYDLVLVDSRLPDIQGERLLQILKGLAPDMAAIMISGNQSPDSSALSLNCCPDAFFIKPMNMERLLEKICELISKQGRV